MHLLYLDDSGSAGNPTEEYLVLGGVSVFEAQADWITSELDKLAQCFGAPDPHDVEFHASSIFSRRQQPWDGLSRDEARGAIKSVLQVLARSYDTARAFACAVHKRSFPGRDPMETWRTPPSSSTRAPRESCNSQTTSHTPCSDATSTVTASTSTWWLHGSTALTESCTAWCTGKASMPAVCAWPV
jgi:hypothetical protein